MSTGSDVGPPPIRGRSESCSEWRCAADAWSLPQLVQVHQPIGPTSPAGSGSSRRIAYDARPSPAAATRRRWPALAFVPAASAAAVARRPGNTSVPASGQGRCCLFLLLTCGGATSRAYRCKNGWQAAWPIARHRYPLQAANAAVTCNQNRHHRNSSPSANAAGLSSSSSGRSARSRSAARRRSRARSSRYWRQGLGMASSRSISRAWRHRLGRARSATAPTRCGCGRNRRSRPSRTGAESRCLAVVMFPEAERGELAGGQHPVHGHQAEQVPVPVGGRCPDAASTAASSLVRAPVPAPRA